MGDYNVACSISNLSIGSGEEVYFIPLLPNNYNKKRGHLVGANSSLIEPTCYFTPFSLPIKGEYDSYGSLDTIKMDDNVLAIQNMLGIDIETFIAAVGEKRDWTDYFGHIFKAYALEKEIISNYNVKFDGNFLSNLGFLKKNNKKYTFQGFPYDVELIKEEDENEYAFKIYNEKDECVSKGSSYDAKKEFQREFHRITGYYLNISKENQKNVELIQSMSGMFVLKDIYEELAKYDLEQHTAEDYYLTEDMAKEYGFTKVPESEQVLLDLHYKTLWRKEGFPYDLKIGTYGSVLIHQRYKEYYVFGDKRFCEEIKRDWFKATKTKPENTFPDPRDIKHVTDKEFEKIKSIFKRLVGTEMGASKSWEDKYSIYSIMDFKKYWEQVSGESIDISKFQEECVYDKEYDEVRISLSENKEESVDMESLINDLPNDERDMLSRIFKEFDMQSTLSLRGVSDRNEFASFLVKYKYFEDLYKQAIIEGKLKKEFTTYRAFFSSMYSCNRFFFPAMNGQQYGDYKSSKRLLETSLQYVNKKIKEYEEDC